MKTLIVGAGPVGMTLALLLSRQGKEVAVIDKRTALSELPRGIAINQQTLAIFDKAGVLSNVIDIGIRVPRLNIYKGEMQIGGITFEGTGLQHPHFFHVRQSEVEKILTNKIKEAGIEVLLGHTLVGISQDTHHAIAEVETPAGGKVHLSAQIVAGCDGGNGPCSRLAGIKIERVNYGGYFQLADVVLSGIPYSQTETHYILSSEGYLMLVPAPRGETRVIASFRGRPGPVAKELNAKVFERILRSRAGGNAKVERLVWSTRSAFGHKVAEHARAGRVVLAGDALHQFSPIGGTNMNVGILDADLLAEAIVTNTLDAYERNRASAVARQIEFTKYLTYLMVRPHGMSRPNPPFVSRSLNELLKAELPPLLTGFETKADQGRKSTPLSLATSLSPSPY